MDTRPGVALWEALADEVYLAEKMPDGAPYLFDVVDIDERRTVEQYY